MTKTTKSEEKTLLQELGLEEEYKRQCAALEQSRLPDLIPADTPEELLTEDDKAWKNLPFARKF